MWKMQESLRRTGGRTSRKRSGRSCIVSENHYRTEPASKGTHFPEVLPRICQRPVNFEETEQKITAPHLRLFCQRWSVVLYHAIKAGRLPRQLHLTFMQRFSSVGKKHLVDYQSSSDKAESPSASSTHDGSYFAFFICTLHAGQTWKGFETEAPQAEQTNSSDLKR